MRVLIIEDDPILNHNISDALKAEGMVPESVFDGLLAEKILKKSSFDCIIVDINLPSKTGFDLCRNFRRHNTETPVLMLTAFSELEDKIKGFDCGADDYLTKPFFMRELILRVNALVRRAKRNEEENDKLIAGDILIDDHRKKVFRQGKEIELTPREYQILLRLARNPGEIVSKNDLIEEIWGGGVGFNTN